MHLTQHDCQQAFEGGDKGREVQQHFAKHQVAQLGEGEEEGEENDGEAGQGRHDEPECRAKHGHLLVEAE